MTTVTLTDIVAKVQEWQDAHQDGIYFMMIFGDGSGAFVVTKWEDAEDYELHEFEDVTSMAAFVEGRI